jgi:hypothetical protein
MQRAGGTGQDPVGVIDDLGDVAVIAGDRQVDRQRVLAGEGRDILRAHVPDLVRPARSASAVPRQPCSRLLRTAVTAPVCGWGGGRRSRCRTEPSALMRGGWAANAHLRSTPQ